MPQAKPFDQSKRSFLAFARFIKVLSIVALFFALPFTVFYVGLVAAIPLFIFCLANQVFIRRIKSSVPVRGKWLPTYYISAVLSGAGSAFGFWGFWWLSHGIDTPEDPVALMLYLAIFAPPIVTGLIIYSMYKWNKISQQQIR